MGVGAEPLDTSLAFTRWFLTQAWSNRRAFVKRVFPLAFTTMEDRHRVYFLTRGTPIPHVTDGRKSLEEATELVEAIASGDRQRILNEAADLAMVASVVATQWGSSIEAAIEYKTALDADRRGDPEQVRYDGHAAMMVGRGQASFEPWAGKRR